MYVACEVQYNKRLMTESYKCLRGEVHVYITIGINVYHTSEV